MLLTSLIIDLATCVFQENVANAASVGVALPRPVAAATAVSM